MASTSAASVADATLDASKLSTPAAKLAFLRDCMARPCRRSASVVICAADVLNHSGIGDAERATITEFAVMAAIDCGQDAKANEWFRGLVRQFGKTSIRVRRLQGMLLEAAGKQSAAAEVYKSVLNDSPVEQYVARRLSAIHRSEGNAKGAIECLKTRGIYRDPKEKDHEFTYSDLFPLDEYAARELLSLNWITCNLTECIRYADELVLFDAANFAHFSRLAELCAIAGQLDRSATAYAHSLRLNPEKNNVRAMYGLLHVANRLISAKAKECRHSKDAAALREFAVARLRAAYAGSKTACHLDLMLLD